MRNKCKIRVLGIFAISLTILMPKREPKDDRLWMLISTHTGNLMMSALGIIKFFVPIQYHQFIFRLSAGSNYISLPNDVFCQLDLN